MFSRRFLRLSGLIIGVAGLAQASEVVSSSNTTPAPATLTFSSSSVTNLPGFTPAANEKPIPVNARIYRLKVEGNKNVKERVVLSEVKTRKSDIYNADQLRKDVQAVYALGSFDDVTLDVSEVPNGVVVTFHVTEKPMVKKIDFKGNKKLSNSKLRDAISLKENEAFDKLKMNLDVDKLISLYKDEGFAAATVEPYTTNDPTTNHVSVTFFITEGVQILVDRVVVTGTKAFPEKKPRKLMKTKRKKVFKQDVLDKDIEEITHFYKNHGYQNVKIGEVQQVFNPEKTRLTIIVTIDEGPLLHFGTSTFSGNSIFLADKLTPSLQYKMGEVFNEEKLQASISKLQDLYGGLGYIRVQVKPKFTQNIEAGITDIDYNITEGEIVYVDHIGIEGNTHTKDFVIRREIKLKEGDPFSSVLARKSVERLYNLGFLDNVDVDVQQPNAPNKADVIFTVAEGKPGILSAGAGFSSVDGLIGTMQVQHINFLGRGQRVNAQWEFGKRRNSFDLGWQDPWFLGKPLTFGVNLFNTTRILPYGTVQSAYTTRDRGGSITAGPRFSDVYNLLFTYTFAQRRRYDMDATLFDSNPDARAAILGEPARLDTSILERKFLNSNITPQLVRDTRDNQFDPTRGQRTSLAITTGGLFPANSIKYNKPIIDHSIHIPTFWKFVLSIHGQWAYIKPYGQSGLDDIVDDLFRVGGPDSIRGYRYGDVGISSLANNEVPGGQVMNVYNVEYKFPIAPDEHGKTLLQGVFFYDIGGSWTQIRDVRYQIGDSPYGLKQGVGFGIRFKTPVFPLRLDYAFPLNLGPGQSAENFNFTIGSLF